MSLDVSSGSNWPLILTRQVRIVNALDTLASTLSSPPRTLRLSCWVTLWACQDDVSGHPSSPQGLSTVLVRPLDSSSSCWSFVLHPCGREGVAERCGCASFDGHRSSRRRVLTRIGGVHLGRTVAMNVVVRSWKVGGDADVMLQTSTRNSRANIVIDIIFLTCESIQTIRRSGVPCPPNPYNQTKNNRPQKKHSGPQK
jgi:hypothetical protein